MWVGSDARRDDLNYFKNYIRIPSELTDEILKKVKLTIGRPGTNALVSLDPGLKLALTLRHLAIGDQ